MQQTVKVAVTNSRVIVSNMLLMTQKIINKNNNEKNTFYPGWCDSVD